MTQGGTNLPIVWDWSGLGSLHVHRLDSMRQSVYVFYVHSITYNPTSLYVSTHILLHVVIGHPEEFYTKMGHEFPSEVSLSVTVHDIYTTCMTYRSPVLWPFVFFLYKLFINIMPFLFSLLRTHSRPSLLPTFPSLPHFNLNVYFNNTSTTECYSGPVPIIHDHTYWRQTAYWYKGWHHLHGFQCTRGKKSSCVWGWMTIWVCMSVGGFI